MRGRWRPFVEGDERPALGAEVLGGTTPVLTMADIVVVATCFAYLTLGLRH